MYPHSAGADDQFLKSCDIMVSFFFLVTGSPQSAGADDQ